MGHCRPGKRHVAFERLVHFTELRFARNGIAHLFLHISEIALSPL